jgi:hypothetical protein
VLYLNVQVVYFVDAVINELDGLSKGCRDRQYEFAEHAEMVRTGAKSAMAYLEREFESRNSHLRALTSEGTVMDTIAFRSEQSRDVVCTRKEHNCCNLFPHYVAVTDGSHGNGSSFID